MDVQNFVVVRKTDGAVVNITVGSPPVNLERYHVCLHDDVNIMIGSTVTVEDGVATLVPVDLVPVDEGPASIIGETPEDVV